MAKAKKLTIGYADFETEHILDLRARGIDAYIKGNEVFYDTPEGPKVPEIGIKCAAIIITTPKGGVTELTARTMPEFLGILAEHSVDRCYFHNLKFDDSFVASWMGDGFMPVDGGWTVRTAGRLLNDMGQVYADKLGFMKGAKVHVCELWDSMKIWATPLRKLGKDFGVYKMGEGNEEALRVGCDARMLEYCLQDCRVVKVAMEYYFEQCNIATQGRRPYGWMTAASTSYGMCMDDLRKRVKSTDAVKEHFPDVTIENGFPEWLREGYKGAVPLLDPEVRGVPLKDVSVYDINSQYPDKLRNYPMPMGMPIQLKGADMDRLMRIKSKGLLWIAKVKLVMDVKAGHRATYMLKHRGDDGNTLAAHINDLAGLNDCEHQVITSADLDYIMRDYDIRYVEVLDAVGFYPDVKRVDRFFGNTVEGHVLAPFIDKWYKVKDDAGRAGNKALKAFAKLILNSLYGKFGADPEHEVAYYEFVDGNMIRVRTADMTETDKHPLYLPVAIFTTAYAREVISKTCNSVGWDHVAYTDTDSVHIHGLSREETEKRIGEAGFSIDPDELGAYDYESRWGDALYVRNKGYFHFNGMDPDTGEPNGDTEIKMAGVNDTSAFKCIADVLNKVLKGIQRRAYRVKGGTLIMEKEVEIDATVDTALKTVVKVKGLSKRASVEEVKRRREHGIQQINGILHAPRDSRIRSEIQHRSVREGYREVLRDEDIPDETAGHLHVSVPPGA